LIGKASVEGYQRGLDLGFRCFELDVWDGKDSEGRPCPTITHGHTIIKSVTFEKVVKFLA